MRRAIPIAVLAALCLVLARPTEARAQKKTTTEDMDKAKEHYKRAQAFKDLKEYDRSAEEFLAAHALFPDPEFFFNVGEVYRLKGDREKALEYFKRYLKEAPNGRVARQAAATVGEIEAAISEERRLAAEAARVKAAEEARNKAEAEARRKAEEKRRKDAEAGRVKAAEEARKKAAEEAARRKADEDRKQADDGKQVEPGGAVEKQPRPARPGRTLRFAGLGTAGAGLIAIALGVKFGLDASSLSDDVSAVGDSPGDRWTSDNLDLIDRGESAETKMMLFTGLGAAAVVAGGVLYYMGSRKDSQVAESSAIAITPSISPSSAGFALSGNF